MNHYFESDFIKRYKLTVEQAEVYMWLKQQNINTDDSTLCYWAKTYTSKRVREVVNFALLRREEGQDIKNIGGWVRRFLKGGQAVVDENCRTNQAFLKEFLERKKWSELKIYEKYVKDIITDEDLSLNMQSEDFERSLEALYIKSQLYKEL